MGMGCHTQPQRLPQPIFNLDTADRTFSPNESSLKDGSGEKTIGIMTPAMAAAPLVADFRDPEVSSEMPPWLAGSLS